ncbi:UDP-N-acetylmuramoyl-L-alanyl-D-glutamate--2,6-diaminopimelate ligase [Echinicola strongylocentroti]|uniref:UDP-N-acetylmuramoyl-L-alanyl-D-glutamate--2,6-diaminopimelate ligase n=1 Tax=Echinicola strongylocentroti TaxID=1795355 RepID=A0A2Z4IHV9_9BACT|nr:UDP-N-acetylmuramoyl-L-alanyl-D-glutamate--2,6-diaminopimelate ligase [Echinicola strongylocentroti]AWW30088.1 UDP-N-acetylmuramoyl-L-alanyl-D-glutamate--2,6-diaminopimelate ligase [Echinicola strongylocentroti]
MKTLKDILYKVPLTSTTGDMEVEVKDIVFDSRKVGTGDVFVAAKGTQVDGHSYIAKAIESGATSVICETLPEKLVPGITYVQVVNSAHAMGIMASNFYDHPSAKLKVVAVTGTNGKTTCVTLLHKLFMELGYMVGMLSTVENKINDEVVPATHTTPDSVAINKLMADMVDHGCTHCFMEASSHAIVQERMAGLQLTGAVFTNISHDHLDYHGTFDEYIKAKKKLFDELPLGAFALVNADDKRGMVMVQNTKASKHTFGLKYPTDFKAKVLSNTLHGLELDLNGRQAWFRMIGEFNAYNVISVMGTALLLGEEEEEVLMQLSSIKGAQGRFDQLIIEGVTAIVDYAHTPDALENVLKTIQGVRTGVEKVITVVGCGGNRDTTKRPVMAKIATEMSDKVVLTSDNPRDEDPMAIIRDMESGVNPVAYKKTIVIADRKEAIKTACVLAEKGDIILVAGKGHETYQEVKGVRHPFDDLKIVKELMELIHTK